MRYETNSLDEPKPSGFDFRRFVLATDISPNDRLKAYAEIEFERFANIEVEKAVERSTNGAAFTEDLEGGNGGEISIEQMWGQYKFGAPFSVRFGQILPPLGRFNINHDDDRWNIPRRTLVDRNVPVLPVQAAWTELGFGFVGSMNVGKSGQLNYQAYVVNGAILDFTVEKALETEVNEPGVLKLASEFSVGARTGQRTGRHACRHLATRLQPDVEHGDRGLGIPRQVHTGVHGSGHRQYQCPRRRWPLQAREPCHRRRNHRHRFRQYRPRRTGLHRYRDRVDRHPTARRCRRDGDRIHHQESRFRPSMAFGSKAGTASGP